MQKAFRVVVAKDANSQFKPPVHIVIHPLHKHQRDVLVRHMVYERFFQHMRKRAVPNIVQQDGRQHAIGFGLCDVAPLLAQLFERLVGQVHGSQRMLQACMLCSGIHKSRQSQLFDTLQALKIWMLYDIEQQIVRDIDEPEHWVIDYFSFIHCWSFVAGGLSSFFSDLAATFPKYLL